MHFPSLRLTREQGVIRAKAAAGQRGYYRLGKGGRDPSQKGPWKPHLDKGKKKGQEIPACDCSGGTAWFLGIDRWQDDGTDDGVWYDTTQILKDALRKKNNQLFRKVSTAETVLPGDLLVYGDKDGHEGHVMIIIRLLPGFKRGCVIPGKEWWRFVEGVDVSTKRGDRACQVRTGAVLWASRGYFVRYLHWAPA